MASGAAPRPQSYPQRGQTSKPTPAKAAPAKAAPAKAAPEPTGYAASPNFEKQRAAAAATPYAGMNWNPKRDADNLIAEYRKPTKKAASSTSSTGLINKYR